MDFLEVEGFPKPLAIAYAICSHLLSDKRPVGSPQMPPGVACYLYSGDSDSVAARRGAKAPQVWRSKGCPRVRRCGTLWAAPSGSGKPR